MFINGKIRDHANARKIRCNNFYEYKIFAQDVLKWICVLTIPELSNMIISLTCNSFLSWENISKFVSSNFFSKKYTICIINLWTIVHANQTLDYTLIIEMKIKFLDVLQNENKC